MSWLSFLVSPASSLLCMDFGTGNNTWLIRVIDLATQTEEQQNGLSEALIGFHAITGCDSNSAFDGKGKLLPFGDLENCDTHVKALRSLSMANIEYAPISAFVCCLWI